MTEPADRNYGGPNPVGDNSEAPWPPAGPPASPNQPPPGPMPHGVVVDYSAYPHRPLAPQHTARRRWWWIALATGAVIITAIVVAVLVLTGRNTDDGLSPTEIAKGYLTALARGDAAAALSYSDEHLPSKDFLTDDILKKQLAKWPITNIRILNAGSEEANTGRVHVAASFGETISDAVLHIDRRHGRWWLASAATSLPANPAPDASDRTLTIFGRPFGASNQYVFPGWLDIASSSPYIDASIPKPLLLDRLTARKTFLQAQFALNDNGVNTVRDAVTAAFAKCEQFHVLKPPYPCAETGLDPNTFVDGNVVWGQSDLSGINSTFDHRLAAVTFSGMVMTDITAQTHSGAWEHFTGRHGAKGVAKLSTVPPTLTFG